MHGEHSQSEIVPVSQWLLLVGLLLALSGYVIPALRLWRRRVWSLSRVLLWAGGVAVAGIALLGPVALRSHQYFDRHMLAHLLLGMLAPVLLVLAAPVTMTLRALPLSTARRLTRLLHRAPMVVVTHPVTATVLDVGGLWMLYRSDLYPLMQNNHAVHVLIHIHMLLSGYLFTYAILGGPDPVSRRTSPAWRALVLGLAISAHTVLARTLYAYPPAGVPPDQARDGAQLMYYGGTAIEISLVVLLCSTWLSGRRRQPAISSSPFAVLAWPRSRRP